MKKILMVAIILIASVSSFAQKLLNQHVGKSYKSYEGVLAKFNTNESYSLSHKFYKFPTNERYNNNVAYPTKQYNFVTEKDSLINKTFRIESTKQFGDGSYEDYALFTLVDTLTQEKLYYVYDSETNVYHLLLTEPVKIIINEEIVKSSIIKDFDDIENQTHISTPYNSPVGLHKYIKNGRTVYYLDLSIEGSTLTRGTGVIVVFSDGTKWVKPIKVDVRYSSGWQYSSWITLTTADLQVLKNKSIKKFRLYIYDAEINPYDGEEFKKYVSLITTMK